MGNTSCASSGTPFEELVRTAERSRRDQRTLSVQAVTGSTRVFVTTLSGETTEIMTAPTETIARFKLRVAAAIGIEPPQQRLVFDGTVVLQEGTLAEYGIGDDARIQLLTTEESAPVDPPVDPRVLEAAKQLQVGPFVAMCAATSFKPRHTTRARRNSDTATGFFVKIARRCTRGATERCEGSSNGLSAT